MTQLAQHRLRAACESCVRRDVIAPRKVVVKMAFSPSVDKRLVGLVGCPCRQKK